MVWAPEDNKATVSFLHQHQPPPTSIRFKHQKHFLCISVCLLSMLKLSHNIEGAATPAASEGRPAKQLLLPRPDHRDHAGNLPERNSASHFPPLVLKNSGRNNKVHAWKCSYNKIQAASETSWSQICFPDIRRRCWKAKVRESTEVKCCSHSRLFCFFFLPCLIPSLSSNFDDFYCPFYYWLWELLLANESWTTSRGAGNTRRPALALGHQAVLERLSAQ